MGFIWNKQMPRHKNQPTGKTTGLRLYPYLRSLFELNETNRRPDGQIELCVRMEFQDYPDVIASIEDCEKSRIQLWRYRYNTGVMGGPPTVYSFQYNNRKQAISAYSGTPLTDEQKSQIVVKLTKRNKSRETSSSRKSVRSGTGRPA